MDSYCLRDYIRRPGKSPEEKAGVKQELMAIQRYQDFNTPENKFLVYFSQILHLNCYQYERSQATQYKSEIQRFRSVIDWFKQRPVVQNIQDKQYKFTQPNYVLQQNHIYRSFYLAYLEYIQKKYEKERIWSFRNQLLADIVYLCLASALLQFEGIAVDALSLIPGSHSPDKGRYLQNETLVAAKVFLEKQVYVFGLIKPQKKLLCDWILTWEIHDLDSNELETKKFLFPIWVFWYRPNDESIVQLNSYLQKLRNDRILCKGLVIYLQALPNNPFHESQIEDACAGRILLCQFPNPITVGSFSNTVALMAQLIKSAVGSPL